MKLHYILCVLLSVTFFHTSRADETAPSIELHLRGKQVALVESAQRQIRQQALQLLETSNFHSDPGDRHRLFTVSGVQRDYRREVAEKFLLVTFPTPRKINTVGGEITVAKIVLGLNRDDYASSLFTIDDTGRIVGHSKYSGQLCIELLSTIKHLTAEGSKKP